MKGSSGWMLVVTLLVIASMAASDIGCSYVDREVSLGNTATGYVPNVWTQTSLTDFQAGGLSRTDVTSAPGSVVLGAAFKDPGVYALAGGTSRSFYRYNITANTWAAMASIPVYVYSGSSMACDGIRYVYALVGSSSTALYRYDVVLNTWSLFNNTPSAIGNGGDLAWDGTYIYVLCGSSVRTIWTLDPATGLWDDLTLTPQTVSTGASMIVSNGALYVARGGGYTTVWRYTIGTGAWATISVSRGAITAGSDMVIGPNGRPYCSYNVNSNWRLESYNPATTSWTTHARVTGQSLGNGGGMACDGATTIFAAPGGGARSFYAYSPSSNTWTSRNDVPAAVTTGGCLVYVPAVRTGYQLSGSFTSSTFDTNVAGAKYIQAFWDRSIPASTALTLEVRSSASLSGGAPSGTWQLLGSGSSGTMSALTGRYVQWRATFTTSDPAVTPQLQEVRIYYRA
ncbi:MAG: hypothetical protein ISF22_10230 [Methanomassiliicoccus sp.]|nr:hypothetical protein [Methanomassiliicoccus sp.]